MANLIRWEPLNDVVSLRHVMDRLFAESYIQPRFMSSVREGVMGQFALDVIEHENEFIVKASVPGFKPEDIESTILGETLSIKGQSKGETLTEQENYLLQERRFGSFQRSLSLPVGVQADKSHADFEDGVLTLTLPKIEAARPQQIKVGPTNGSTRQ